MLSLLRDTPVNCLVLPWATGQPGDRSLRESLLPLLKEGRRLGLHFVGRAEGDAGLSEAAASAQAAGVSALLSGITVKKPLPVPVFELAEHSQAGSNGSSPAVISDAFWPAIRSGLGAQGATAEAGPTGLPWLDSNSWLIQLARSRLRQDGIWLAFPPPESPVALPAESYLLALADTESYGARWVISLDRHFQAGLADRDASAMERWQSLTNALNFFRSRAHWSTLQTKATLGVVLGPAGAPGVLDGEVLNLLQRRLLPFRVIGPGQNETSRLEGIQALLSIHPERPEAERRQWLMDFAEQGGLLIVPSSWGKLPLPSLPDGLESYATYRHGSGRVAVALEEWQDPYVLAQDTHLLLSRRNDLFRLGNGLAMNVRYTASADGRNAVIHLVNFERRASRRAVSLWVKQPFRTARIWRLDSPEPVPLRVLPEGTGRELALPGFATYAAVELIS
jgi:hypothetical protein